MFFLGIPTTRAGSVVTSDSKVLRDVYYSGNPSYERCSVVLRIAPTFLRFGSFEIFKPADEFTGRQGPSYGREEIRGQMLDYVIEMFYPEIQQNYPDRVERNVAFFREWQCVGFCHGVLNTDNMSVLGLTLDYGPYGFMDRSDIGVWMFDPDFICNASDNSGRYSYKAQPAICRWNLVKLAEALAPELPTDRAKAVIDEYLDQFNRFYLENMRKKLGLLRKEEPEDEILITELLRTMHDTGGAAMRDLKWVLPCKKRAFNEINIDWFIFHFFPPGADFTNTFRSLSQISCPSERETEQDKEIVKKATELFLAQCASLEELKSANTPTMDPR
ncbi:Protein adenylyltransferase SelO-1, mitochondrial [Xenoophorus captivus]|uniref:Selenoprotein O n=1 Tax=Xenoophorus captivus TaxID=1517983 RepID=A0ABV0RP02_9TELE